MVSTSPNNNDHEISAFRDMDPIVANAGEDILPEPIDFYVPALISDNECELPAFRDMGPIVSNADEDILPEPVNLYVPSTPSSDSEASKDELSASLKANKCDCSTSGRALVVCIDGTANQFSKKVSH
jgi:hypothetical protein